MSEKNARENKKMYKEDCKADQLQPRFYFDSGDAVSELVATLLLTVVVTVGIGIVAVSFLSNVSPLDIPALNVDLAERDANIVLIHDGGDPVYKATTMITVDGIDRTDDFKTPEGDDWDTFSVGDQLISSIPRTDETTIQIIYTAPENPTVVLTLLGRPVPPPDAHFNISPSEGYIPLGVTFTDLSTGYPTSWLWEFGDGSISTGRHPTHTYGLSRQYEVTLTSCNVGGCDSISSNVTAFGFADYLVNESVFVYGTELFFLGDSIVGEGSTIILTGDFLSAGGGSNFSVSNMYINGSVDLTWGIDLGSQANPGLIDITGPMSLSGGVDVYCDEIYVDGGTELDSAEIYGDLYSNSSFDFYNGDTYGEVHVNGDLTVTNGDIHDNVYVDGDLTLGWTPSIDPDAYIYYTGSINHPLWYPQYLLDKCIHVDSVPEFSMPEFIVLSLPSIRSDDWYDTHGYVSGGSLADNKKIFAESYSTYGYLSPGGENVIIVASDGDITLNSFWGFPVTGVLFAPNGRVTFSGGEFEGTVIARNGFYVTSGSTDVIFRNIDEYISDSEDYPFED